MSKSSAPKQTKRSTTLLARLLAASLVIAFFGGVQCVYAADSMDSNLTKLEDKFFQHNYPKDAVGDRLERLEKLMYGESKTGSDDERLKTLMNLVPNLDEKVDDGASAPPKAQAPEAPPRRPALKPQVPQVDTSSAEPSPNDSSYPAVTAMEKKLLGRDYIGESVGKRLDRLEIKAYGKTAASEDLQDRVDRLKSSTGIDIAKVKPANSEWADEDEDPSGGVQPFTGIGSGDDPNSQRNLRKQASNSFNRPSPSYDPYAGTGTFGAGGSSHSVSSGSSGSFGTGAGTYRPDPMPPAAPDYSQSSPSAPIPAPTMGVRQQISLLEREVFKKTYDNETLLSRLNRLEQTVFPQDKAASDKSLPERMNHLLAAVPISQATEPPVAPAPKRKRGGDPDFPDLDFPGPGSIATQQGQTRGPSGLSKIINGLGGALGGGYTTGYSTTPGTLVTDPSTGLLFDQYTGTLIDPMTGAVVGRRQVASYGNGFGGYGNSYQSYGGFNSGMSPMSPFGGMGTGMGMGMGNRGGVNFGFGGGGMRWP